MSYTDGDGLVADAVYTGACPKWLWLKRCQPDCIWGHGDYIRTKHTIHAPNLLMPSPIGGACLTWWLATPTAASCRQQQRCVIKCCKPCRVSSYHWAFQMLHSIFVPFKKLHLKIISCSVYLLIFSLWQSYNVQMLYASLCVLVLMILACLFGLRWNTFTVKYHHICCMTKTQLCASVCLLWWLRIEKWIPLLKLFTTIHSL